MIIENVKHRLKPEMPEGIDLTEVYQVYEGNCSPTIVEGKIYDRRENKYENVLLAIRKNNKRYSISFMQRGGDTMMIFADYVESCQ